VNYFRGSSIDNLGTNTKISGCYFGFDPPGVLVLPYQFPNKWIFNLGLGTIVGLSYHGGPSNPAVAIERNIFAPALVSIYSSSSGATSSISIVGNWFGYDLNGVALTNGFADAIAVRCDPLDPNSPAQIGTNNDGINDDLESNWFGCVKDNYVTILDNCPTTISGNHFGYSSTLSSTGSTITTLSCQASSSYINLNNSNSAVVIGMQQEENNESRY